MIIVNFSVFLRSLLKNIVTIGYNIILEHTVVIVRMTCGLHDIKINNVDRQYRVVIQFLELIINNNRYVGSKKNCWLKYNSFDILQVNI